MKRLIRISVLFILILSSCTNSPENVQENSPTTTAIGNVQEGAPTETTVEQGASTNLIEIVGGNEDSLREFMKQWLVPIYPSDSSEKMTIYIGSLPKDIPYELPKPEDARIIGSITGGGIDYALIFDTSLSPKSIHEFYAQNLTDKEWHEAATNGGQGGFISQADLYSEYCHTSDDAFLSVQTPSGSSKKTTIRLNLELSPNPYNCDVSFTSSGYLSEKLIPQLEAPAGTIIQSGGSGSSDHDAEVTASLQSNLSAIELAEFYNPQLLALGWTMQGSGNEKGAAWSHWTLTDDQKNNWLGSLIVLKVSPNSDRLFAVLRIEKEN